MTGGAIKPQKILIDGNFLCRRLTGIERYAFEITRRLDGLIKQGGVSIIVPANANNVPQYKNIEIIRCRKKVKSHLWWQMVTLQWFLALHREYMVLEFSNTCLPFFPGIVFLHDIYCELFPGDFTGTRDKITRRYNRWQYRLIAGKAKKIITVSNFSRRQIAETYGVEPEQIAVIYNGWEHMKNIVPDYSVFTDYPQLTEKNYFFALGSLSKRKNLKWILDYSLNHPETIFAVSGTALPTTPDKSLDGGGAYRNIILLGYLDDGKVKALMEKCRAFIMPSYYEGFGIPPLEALSCGVPAIVSRAASLPEIYGDTVHYIDPFDTGIDLDELLKEEAAPPGPVFEKCSYDRAAGQLYQLLKDMDHAFCG